MTKTEDQMIDIKGLSISFSSPSYGTFKAVKNISLQVKRGEIVALVGESGSGKTVTASTIPGLLDETASVSGSILVDGIEATDKNNIDRVRRRVAMIFQEPMTSLNPVYTIGNQIAEAIKLRSKEKLSKKQVRKKVVDFLQRVRLRDAEKRIDSYPHELSGGQRQRVVAAIALVIEPDYLIADEPTTALDVTIQAQILQLLQDIQEERGMGLLFITHDLMIVRKIAHRVYVMEKGKIVEEGETEAIFNKPKHPYTQKLLSSMLEPIKRKPGKMTPTILSLRNLKVYFPVPGFMWMTKGYIRAVDDVSLTVSKGENLGIVGESGAGKSTLGRALLGLEEFGGEVALDGIRVQDLSDKEIKKFRRDIQIVFQDPRGSLNPRLLVGDIVGEGLSIHRIGNSKAEREKLILKALKQVGLVPEQEYINRYPHKFSGGQRQRIAIARALILKPKIIILDEPTSSLDATVQREVIELLLDIQEKFGLTYIFISHDFQVIQSMCHNIAVMRNGKLIEFGTAKQILENPQEKYTKTLVKAALEIEAV